MTAIFEQLKFLGKLVKNKLPVSAAALADTQANLYVETSANGWALYGKTGTGAAPQQNAWFVGWTQKQGQTYLFVLNAQDLTAPDASALPAGVRAQNLAKEILREEGVF